MTIDRTARARRGIDRSRTSLRGVSPAGRSTREDRRRQAFTIELEQLEQRRVELGEAAWRAEQFEARARALQLMRERTWERMTSSQLSENINRERRYLRMAIRALEAEG